MKEKLKLTKDWVHNAYDSRFIKVFGLEYVAGKQYMNATRRDVDDLVALKSDEEFKEMLPDAVSCVVILNGAEPKLLLTYEFRYPTGQYLLSVPAGLIDKSDEAESDPILSTAKRELKEETNIDLTEEDKIEIINPLLFSTPGMTDESNALVCVVISDEQRLHLSQEGAEGTESFDGFVTLTKDEAKRILKQGKDDRGIFYSVYTWAALMHFVSGMWK
ncbi:MAG: NUDIX hydrolase [Lachnospiraceae bacterium]|nr:NUDIX hydrolase [Lachnospiraceae bacterium]